MHQGDRTAKECSEPDRAARTSRPCARPALLQPLRAERHADAVMPQNLDQVASHAPEHVEITSIGSPRAFWT
jgi:hypothetical protein